MSIIQIQHLYKTFGTGENAVHALEDISLDIQKGEIFGIIGLSGAGKSTLVRCMNLLERPTSGTVIVDGKDMTALSEKELRLARRNVTMIFQSFNLLPNLTVAENIILSMDASGKSFDKSKKAIVEELLKQVHLPKEYTNERILHLSGGEQQRVAIARALSYGPSIIVADEPTGNLDLATQDDIMGIFRTLAHDGHRCVIIVTHSPEVAKTSDEVFELAPIRRRR